MKNRIKELRKQRGLNQDYLAKEIGTTQQTLSRIENGIYMPSVDLIINIAKYFGVTLDYLLCQSNAKRSVEIQSLLNEKMEIIFELNDLISKLNETNKKTAYVVLERLLEGQKEMLNKCKQ